MAFKQGLLQHFLEGDVRTLRYIYEYQPLLTALWAHPRFKMSFAREVKDGIVAAFKTMFPEIFPKQSKKR